MSLGTTLLEVMEPSIFPLLQEDIRRLSPCLFRSHPPSFRSSQAGSQDDGQNSPTQKWWLRVTAEKSPECGHKVSWHCPSTWSQRTWRNSAMPTAPVILQTQRWYPTLNNLLCPYNKAWYCIKKNRQNHWFFFPSSSARRGARMWDTRWYTHINCLFVPINFTTQQEQSRETSHCLIEAKLFPNILHYDMMTRKSHHALES